MSSAGGSALGQHGVHLLLSAGWVAVLAGLVVRSRLAPRHGHGGWSLSRRDRVRAALRGWPAAVAMLNIVAAAVHLAVISEHFEESALFGTFFLVLTVVQFGYAALVVLAPGGAVLKAGAAASVAVVLLWVVSRTVGLPVGPEAGTPEEIGSLDVVASAAEFLAALLSLAALRAVRAGRYGRRLPATVTETRPVGARIAPNALPTARAPHFESAHDPA